MADHLDGPMRLIAASFVVLSACAGSLPVEQPEPPPIPPPEFLAGTTTPPVVAAPAVATPGSPGTDDAADATMSPAVAGQLTEAEFKVLHMLKDGGVSTLVGSPVVLSDSSTAYLSLPLAMGEEPVPSVLLVHEWWGLNDHVKLYADRLAAEGYATLAVDLYQGAVAKDADTAMAAMKSVDATQARATIDAGLGVLRDDPRFSADHIAVFGWSFGGGWSLDTALRTPDVSAAVMYYGRVQLTPEALTPLQAPLLGIFANQDEGIPVETVDEFEAALKTAGKDAAIHRYDATHAFANPSSAHYDALAAGDAWEKTRAFLRTHLVDAPGAVPAEAASGAP
jgi:carboxymethylenebutenolidase